MTQIKLAKESDAEFIAILGRITFTESFGHLFKDKNDLIDYYERTFSVQKIRNGITNPKNIFWIATVNDLPVGYAKLKLDSKTEFLNSESICQLQKIYVLKDFLSMKIGLKLQDTLLNTAKEKGFNEIWLSVYEENERAINFYLKNDFQQIGNHKFKIGKEEFDFIVMLKKLK